MSHLYPYLIYIFYYLIVGTILMNISILMKQKDEWWVLTGEPCPLKWRHTVLLFWPIVSTTYLFKVLFYITNFFLRILSGPADIINYLTSPKDKIVCPQCTSQVGNSRFCSHCGHDFTHFHPNNHSLNENWVLIEPSHYDRLMVGITKLRIRSTYYTFTHKCGNNIYGIEDQTKKSSDIVDITDVRYTEVNVNTLKSQ